MERDAHYYAILAYCRACGFNKESSQVIAYASQFVDDAKINLIFINNPDQIEPDMIQNRPALFNMATCHSYFRIRTFNYEAMVNNTCAFHFIPGGEGENFTKKLRCKEESPLILEILNDALAEDDLLKFGIALHTYADTFSHQNFSGMLSKVNDIKNCEAKTKISLNLIERLPELLRVLSQDKFERYLDRILPAYGHGQAGDFPDTPYLTWSYEYDYSDEFNGSFQKMEIDNRERYQRAFQGIKKYLMNYLIKHNEFRDDSVKFANFELLTEALLMEGHRQRREKNWQRVLVEQGLLSKEDQDILKYNENKWLKEAFKNYDQKVFSQRHVEGAELAGDFANSCWYRFYKAVKWYKQKFFRYSDKYGLNIPT